MPKLYRVTEPKLPVYVGLVVAIVICQLMWLWAYFAPRLERPAPTVANLLMQSSQPASLHPVAQLNVAQTKSEVIAARRSQAIARVQSFMRNYGSPLVDYAPIIVDQAEACGGDYRILVGIAGSESGLGRINYKKYNPYGYLNGVQYGSYEEALQFLSCRISQQFIRICGSDLKCLAKRYIGGGGDDPNLFISKVAWFSSQV